MSYIHLYCFSLSTATAYAFTEPRQPIPSASSDHRFDPQGVEVERGATLGKRDSIHRHLLETSFETADVPDLRHELLYTTPSGWWCIESVI